MYSGLGWHKMELKEVIKQAEREHSAEVARILIEQYKQKLRARANRTFWKRIFPWKITITRRDNHD